LSLSSDTGRQKSLIAMLAMIGRRHPQSPGEQRVLFGSDLDTGAASDREVAP